MKNFLSENWFKLLIATTMIFLAAAVGYYFFFFLPKNIRSEALTENKLSCSQMEEKIKSNYDKEWSDAADYMFSSNHYNQRLQKCIVSITYEWKNAPPVYSRTWVLDAIENTVLLDSSERSWNDNLTYTCSIKGDDPRGQCDRAEKIYMTE